MAMLLYLGEINMNKKQFGWLILAIILSPILMLDCYYLEVKRMYQEMGSNK